MAVTSACKCHDNGFWTEWTESGDSEPDEPMLGSVSSRSRGSRHTMFCPPELSTNREIINPNWTTTLRATQRERNKKVNFLSFFGMDSTS